MNTLIIGVPREIKSAENRVALIPTDAARLTKAGVKVFIEKNAGIQSGFSNEDYTAAGAELIPTAKLLYQKTDIILKVKEPQSEEFALLRKGQFLFCFLHLATPEHYPLCQVLIHSQVTAIGFETLERRGILPLLAPMSEIAGGLSALYAHYFKGCDSVLTKKVALFTELQKIAREYPLGPEKYASGNVIIFGGGAAGKKAAELSLKLGSKVIVTELKPENRTALGIYLKTLLNKDLNLEIMAPSDLKPKALEAADILIGCVHARGQRAFKVLTESELKVISTNQKKIMMDVAIDQGGNFPLAKPTSYQEPVYQDPYGNLRFSVANIPSLCGNAASQALSQAATPYVLSLAKEGDKAFTTHPELFQAINIKEGKITLAAIIEAHEKTT